MASVVSNTDQYINQKPILAAAGAIQLLFYDPAVSMIITIITFLELMLQAANSREYTYKSYKLHPSLF